MKTPVIPVRRRPWKAVAAAAIIAVVAGSAWWAISQQQPGKQPRELATRPASKDGDIPPGGNRAQLVLASGRSVLLEQAADGRIS